MTKPLADRSGEEIQAGANRLSELVQHYASLIGIWAAQRRGIEEAQRELIGTQARLAKLLNSLDGGGRKSFDSFEQWLDRQDELNKMNVRAPSTEAAS